LNIRQQTNPPPVPTKLLVVSLAPPFVEGVGERKRAESATTSDEDKLRFFLEAALEEDWRTPTDRGITLLLRG
jgi:hypothetical protein